MNIITKTSKEDLIAAKEKEIEQLRKEIKQLRGPVGLAQMVSKKMIDTRYGKFAFNKSRNCPDEALWQHICRICYEVHRENHRPRDMRFNTLTDAEKKVAAEMADKIIDIWNKYVVQVYWNEIDADTLKECCPEKKEKKDNEKKTSWDRKPRRVIATRIDTGEKEIYKSITYAAECVFANRNDITKAANGEKEIVAGRTWKYFE